MNQRVSRYGWIAAGAGGVLLAALLGAAGGRLLDKVILGPADEIVLSGTPAPLTLSNQDGRLAWGSQPSNRVLSLGTLHLDRIMRAILQSTSYEAERRTVTEEAETQNKDFESRFKELEQKYGHLTKESPEYPEAEAAFRGLRGEFDAWVAGMQRIQSRLAVEQMERAYKEILVAVDVVAERDGIDLIMRFVPAERPFEAGSVADAMLQIHARPMLHMPESIDVTDAVMKEMAVSDPVQDTHPSP